MAVYFTGTPNPRAKLDVGGGASGGILSGQAVRVTKFPIQGVDPDDTHLCKICPDGERPDAVCTTAFDDSGNVGAIAYLDAPRLRIRMGGAIAAASPATCPRLKVSGGNFTPVGAMERGYVRPRTSPAVAVASGDLIGAWHDEGVGNT